MTDTPRNAPPADARPLPAGIAKPTLGDRLRSTLFALTFYPLTVLCLVAYVPTLLLPERLARPICYSWVDIFLWFARHVLRIDYRVEIDPAAREAIAAGPVVIASKHQSMWETLVFNRMLDRPVFVLKKELVAIPLFGRFLTRFGMISVDRAAGARALKPMVQQAQAHLAAGRIVVIYPQGTRVAPGAEVPYLPGVAALYARAGVPMIPVALDAGRLWPRHRFVKRAGTITVRFLAPLEPGLDRKTFMKTLEDRIEQACG